VAHHDRQVPDAERPGRPHVVEVAGAQELGPHDADERHPREQQQNTEKHPERRRDDRSQNDQDAVGAKRAGFSDLVRLEHEVLAQAGAGGEPRGAVDPGDAEVHDLDPAVAQAHQVGRDDAKRVVDAMFERGHGAPQRGELTFGQDLAAGFVI